MEASQKIKTIAEEMENGEGEGPGGGGGMAKMKTDGLSEW